MDAAEPLYSVASCHGSRTTRVLAPRPSWAIPRPSDYPEDTGASDVCPVRRLERVITLLGAANEGDEDAGGGGSAARRLAALIVQQAALPDAKAWLALRRRSSGAACGFCI